MNAPFILHEPGAADGKPWLVCESRAADRSIYDVLSSHETRAAAEKEILLRAAPVSEQLN